MDETTPSTPQSAGGNKNMLMIGLFVVIALAVLGGIFLMGRSKNNTPAGQAQTVVASPTPEGVVVEVTQEAAPTGENVTAGDEVTTGAEKTFAIEASSFKFNPSTITVKKGDTVKIVLTNKSGMHNWTNDEFNASTKTIPAGQTDTISFVADKAGTYEYYCSTGNHRQMGMVGKLIVQ